MHNLSANDVTIIVMCTLGQFWNIFPISAE